MTKEEKQKAIKKELIGVAFTILKLRQETDFANRIRLGIMGKWHLMQIQIIQSQPLPKKGGTVVGTNNQL